MQDNENKKISQEIVELVSLFDLLARFDFEDKQKSGINTDSLDSAPKGSMLGPEFNKK